MPNPTDANCIRAVYLGAPDDYPQVQDIPADLLLSPDANGRYEVERGVQVTVVTAAPLPASYTRFYLQQDPVEQPWPVSSSQLIPPVGTTYTFTPSIDPAAADLITFDLHAARPWPFQRPGLKPELGDVIVRTTFAIPSPPLTLELASSRDLCTANTLTELSWTIAGGRPPYTLTIDGETVDANAESHRANCGPLMLDPLTEEPLPDQNKTFSAAVSDAQETGTVASASIRVDLAPALIAPVDITYASHDASVQMSWDWNRTFPRFSDYPTFALLRHRPAASDDWRYLIAQPLRSDPTFRLELPTGNHLVAVAAIRHEIELQTPDALQWSDARQMAGAFPPPNVRTTATHDTITVSWDRQPHLAGQRTSARIRRSDLTAPWQGGWGKSVDEVYGQSGRHELVFPGMEPNTEYRVQVDVGVPDSVIEIVTSVRTLAPPPGWTAPPRGPQNLGASATDACITANWDLPYPGAPNRWFVELFSSETGQPWHFAWIYSKSSWTICGSRSGHPLNAGAQYRIRVEHLSVVPHAAEIVVTTDAAAQPRSQRTGTGIGQDMRLLPFAPQWPVSMDGRFAMTDDPFEWLNLPDCRNDASATPTTPAALEPTYTLTVIAGEGGSIDPLGTTTHTEASTVPLTARWNDATHTFGGWSGDCSGSDTTCTLEMYANASVTAAFTPLPADRCTSPTDANCIRAVYQGAPDDYAQVQDIPDSVLIHPDDDGRYRVERGQQYTVVTAARLPEGYNRFYLRSLPGGEPWPTSLLQLVLPAGTTYTFTVSTTERAASSLDFQLHAASAVVVTTAFKVPPPLTFELTSSRDLCTANTLTELSWTIAGGRPPYTLTIDGETVDATAESHRVNCGPLVMDPQAEEPLPNQTKTFSASVTDSPPISDTATATALVELAPPLPKPSYLFFLPEVGRVEAWWEQVKGAGSQFPPEAFEGYAAPPANAFLVRWRAHGTSAWRYVVGKPSRSSDAAHDWQRPGRGISEMQVAAMRHPLEETIPTALSWSDLLTYSEFVAPENVTVSATHDTVTVSWDRQPYTGYGYVSLTRGSTEWTEREFDDTAETGRWQVTFRHLPPDSEYEVEVVKWTYEAEAGTVATVRTTAAPSDFQPLSRGASNVTTTVTHDRIPEITIRWDEPFAGAEPRYLLQVFEAATGAEVDWHWLTEKPFVYTARGKVGRLKPGTTYRIEILHLAIPGVRVSIEAATRSQPAALEPTYTLTVTAGAGGSVNPVGATTHDEAAEVTLTASWNDATHTFAGWSGACSATATTCVLEMYANASVTAAFTPLPADRCASPTDADCIRAVYKGAPGDYAQVQDIPADLIIQPNTDGHYVAERGQQITVVTAAQLPTGYTRFYLRSLPGGEPWPTSLLQLVLPAGTTYTFTVSTTERAASSLDFQLHAATAVVVTTAFKVPPPLTLELTSSRDLCTANTLTELSWTISGGRPPYTLTIDGETVAANAESHRANCGPIPTDPFTGDPLPDQTKMFSANVSDSQATVASTVGEVTVDLSPPLPKPSDLYFEPRVGRVDAWWEQVRGAGSQFPEEAFEGYAAPPAEAFLVRWRARDAAAWRYTVGKPSRSSDAATDWQRPGLGIFEMQVAAMRHPLEAETPAALSWSDKLTYSEFVAPENVTVSATHDMVTVSWDRQPYTGRGYVSLRRGNTESIVRGFVDTTATGRLQAVFPHLPPASEYRVEVVKVAVEASVGTVTTVRTAAAPYDYEPPTRGPQNLRATTTHDRITIRWDEPFAGAEPTYLLQVFDKISGSKVDWRWVYGKPFEYTARGKSGRLRPATTYRIQILHLAIPEIKVVIEATTASKPASGEERSPGAGSLEPWPHTAQQ